MDLVAGQKRVGMNEGGSKNNASIEYHRGRIISISIISLHVTVQQCTVKKGHHVTLYYSGPMCQRLMFLFTAPVIEVIVSSSFQLHVPPDVGLS